MTRQHAELEFREKLEKLMLNLRERAENQFKYNLEKNIPKGIAGITYQNATEHALECALVSAGNAMSGWSCDAAISSAHRKLRCCQIAQPAIDELEVTAVRTLIVQSIRSVRAWQRSMYRASRLSSTNSCQYRR